jgi:hypothetical protein
MVDGFLGRWAKRKEAVRKGIAVPEEPAAEAKDPVPPPTPANSPSPQPSPAGGRGSSFATGPGTADAPSQPSPASASGTLQDVAPSPPRGEGRGEGVAALEPPPTLEDTRSLTPDSDFTRFTRPGVPADVKNAALKKLFADPHFNVMDRLDVYIDDYGKPDPLPPEMLRKLASAQFLRLFDEEQGACADGESADHPPAQNVAQSAGQTDPAVPPADDHADPDLRLQQDDAPGSGGPGQDPR